MKDKPYGRQARQWHRRPAPAVRYGLFERVNDWLAAGRDAKVGLPGLLVTPGDEPDGGPVTGWATPHTASVGQLGRGKAEREWITYKAEVAGDLIRLAEARARRAATERLLAEAQQRADALPEPSEQQLLARVSGEERTDAGVRAARRMKAYTAQQGVVRREVEQLRGALVGHDVEIAGLREPVRIRFEVAQTRSSMIDAYVRRRCAAYLTRLVRRHPDGPQIGAMLRTGWIERPEWTTRAGSPDVGPPEGGA